MKRLRVILSLLSVTALFGCGAPAPPPGGPLGAAEPFVFAQLSKAGRDFSVRQHVEWKGGGRAGEFDAVLQKQGEALTLVGLGPMGTRAFVLRQTGNEIAFEPRPDAPIPFPPRKMAIDVHRSYFKRLPSPAREGESEGEVDGEHVSEEWKAGELVVRRFSKGRSADVRVHVRYGKGCSLERCAPDHISYSDVAHGYELEISNVDYSFF